MVMGVRDGGDGGGNECGDIRGNVCGNDGRDFSFKAVRNSRISSREGSRHGPSGDAVCGN